MLTDALDAFVERLKHVPGIVAIVVGGSRARGTADPSSDTDLGLYYDRQSPLNVAALDAIATACDDRKCAGLITELGAWGPWINGGGWLRLDGQSVDLLFRETSKIEAALDDAILGQIEIAYQPGHPFGFLSSIYVGEVALCLPLWDPSHWVAKAKEKIDGYPERLRRELVRRFVFEADFSLLISDKSINRSDVTYVAGCLFRSIGCVLQIVFALNRKHWMNEKGALALADRFELVPAHFKKRVERAWQHLEPNPVSLREAIRTVRELTEEVNRLLRQEGLG
jgi:Nucleotidyltransferase domain